MRLLWYIIIKSETYLFNENSNLCEESENNVNSSKVKERKKEIENNDIGHLNEPKIKIKKELLETETHKCLY